MNAEKRKIGRPRTGRKSSAGYSSAYKDEHNTIERQECADPKRRAGFESDPKRWLKWYLAGAFTRPFEKPHDEIIAGAVEAHSTDGKFAVAGERGIGKSALLWGLVLYMALTGKRRFPVCVPWADKAL